MGFLALWIVAVALLAVKAEGTALWTWFSVTVWTILLFTGPLLLVLWAVASILSH